MTRIFKHTLILVLLFSSSLKAQGPYQKGVVSIDSIYFAGLQVDPNDTVSQSFHIYKPNSYDTINSPFLIAFHGQGGSGAKTINNLFTIAERRKALVIGVNRLAGSGFQAILNLGEPTYDDYDTSGCILIKPASEVLKLIYQYVMKRENRINVPCYMTGFSAGGQFVTRYMLFRQAYPDSIPIKMAISANPYFYTFPIEYYKDSLMDYACGLYHGFFSSSSYCAGSDQLIRDLNCNKNIINYYNENYGVLIGTADTAFLLNSPCVMQQGANRLERARAFYAFADSNAVNRGTTLKWQYDEVPGIAHDEAGMYNTKVTPTDSSTIMETLLFDTPYHPSPIISTQPIPDFTWTQVTSGANTIVDFTNLSHNASSYLWNFGDGFISTQANPSHTYNLAGTYSVVLTAYDSSHCGQSIAKQWIVTVTQTSPQYAEKYIKKFLHYDTPFNWTVRIPDIAMLGQSAIMIGDNYGGTSYLISLAINGDTISTDRIYQKSFYPDRLLNISGDGIYTTGFDSTGKLIVLKTDSLRNTVWIKHYDIKGNRFFTATIANDIFIVLSTSDSINIIKINYAGQVLSRYTFPTGISYLYLTDLESDSDNLYLTGNYYFAGSYKPFILKIDKDGNFLWGKIHGSAPYIGYVTSRIINSNTIAFAYNNGNAPYGTQIAILDSVGNAVISKSISNFDFCKILRTSDDNLLIAGSDYISHQQELPKIIKFNHSLDTLWTKSYNTWTTSYFPEYHKITSAVNTVDNGFLMGGISFIIKTDSAGNSGCREVYAPTRINNISLPVTNINLTGTQTTLFSGPAIVNHLPPSLHFSTLCLTTEVEDLNYSNIKTLLYPNPATNKLNIVSSLYGTKIQLLMHDYIGRLVMQAAYSVNKGETIILDVSSISSGVYYLTLTNNIIKSTVKFIKD